jgi:hypothetical protein
LRYWRWARNLRAAMRDIGLLASQNWMNSVIEYQKAVECVQHDSVKLRMDTQ